MKPEWPVGSCLVAANGRRLIATTLALVAGCGTVGPQPVGDGRGRGAGSEPARTIEVHVGMNFIEPSDIVLVRGERVALVFTRIPSDGCPKVMIDPFLVWDALPEGQPLRVTLTPRQTGAFRYTCSVGKAAGTIHVVAEEHDRRTSPEH